MTLTTTTLELATILWKIHAAQTGAVMVWLTFHEAVDITGEGNHQRCALDPRPVDIGRGHDNRCQLYRRQFQGVEFAAEGARAANRIVSIDPRCDLFHAISKSPVIGLPGGIALAKKQGRGGRGRIGRSH